MTATKGFPSWIQSNPDFGFGFKALVCHDGVCGRHCFSFQTNSLYHKVFDSHYNGYSTDELFFVGSLLETMALLLIVLSQFNHDFGGQPWTKNTQELTKKFVVYVTRTDSEST